MAKVFKDADVKMEILIKLAFGYTYKDIATAYGFKPNTIVNLRKNNYKLYNKLVDSFRILDEVAVLGLLPIPERAVNICKRFYNKRFIIQNNKDFYLNERHLTISGVINLANNILQLDNIDALENLNITKNLYMKTKELKRERKTCN